MTPLNLDYNTGAAYYGDCADIMTAWKNQGVQGIIDLIYLDPPFNSNRNYGAPTSKAKDTDTGSLDAFTDMWTYDAPARERTERICKTSAHPAGELIGGLRGYLEKRDDGMLAYLTYMADRLWLLHGLLKETGSIYLHCDPSANYYLRLLMDSVFGQKNFRNEIVWKRATSAQKGSQYLPKTWGNNTDTILYYAKSNEHKPHPFRSLTEQEIADKFAKTDEHGRKYQVQSGSIFRALSMGDRPNLCYEWRGFRNPHPSGWRLSKKRLEEEYQKGNIVIRKDGKLERRQFLEDYPGIKPGNLWDDIPPAMGNEREGYPTQKPMALLDRIIKASSNEGDVVLDPFCGCGTALHSAYNLKRQFIGIDISVFSIYSVTKERLREKCGLEVPVYGIPTNIEGARLLAKQDWESFEAWAAESLNFGDIGILSNKIKRCDGGVDGKGKLFGKTADGEDEVIVQVKSGAPTIDQVKAFANIIQSNRKVAAGIFITLDESDWTAGMEKWAQSLGAFTMPDGTRSFRRMQHWPVSDRFAGEDGVYPKMPIMVNPLNGKPLVNIGHTF